jgi:hypothetical protein
MPANGRASSSVRQGTPIHPVLSNEPYPIATFETKRPPSPSVIIASTFAAEVEPQEGDPCESSAHCARGGNVFVSILLLAAQEVGRAYVGHSEQNVFPLANTRCALCSFTT